MSVPTEFHSTLCETYSALCKSVRQPITEVKAEWNVAADVREIIHGCLKEFTLALKLTCRHINHRNIFLILNHRLDSPRRHIFSFLTFRLLPINNNRIIIIEESYTNEIKNGII